MKTRSEAVVEAMAALQRPFPSCDVEWRIARSGKKRDGTIWAKVLAYITARAVHERLDEVFGLAGWRTEFRVMEVPDGKNGIICRIWFRDPDTGDWTWKENGADQTDFESFKGGLSDAEKRAFAELGGGRYLYNLTEGWAETATSKSDAHPNYAQLKSEDGGDTFYWAPPQLPEWALPPDEQGEAPLNPLASVGLPPTRSPGEPRDAQEDAGTPTKPVEEESPFDDGQVSTYENVILPSPGTKGINNAKAVLGYAQTMGWSEADFVAWQTSIVNKPFSEINAAQSELLLNKIKEIAKKGGPS